jgi:hypothetical protein
MLSLRVANHKSMLVSADGKESGALTVAAIFGANASGKSNLLDGLRFTQHAVLASFAEWEPGFGIPRTPFRLDVAAPELALDGVHHLYGFALDDEVVREERLHGYPRRRKRVIFERTDERRTFGPEAGRTAAALRELTSPCTLFLSVAARSEHPAALPVYRWFQCGLAVRDGQRHDGHLRRGTSGLVGRIETAGAARRQVLFDLRQLADFGIAEVALDPDTGRLVFRQGAGGTELTLAELSAGTRSWLQVLVDVLEILDTGAVYAVDELNTSLHPRLVARLIELFRDPRTNPRGAQFLFTTHDATLLGTNLGAETLRRDEVWFVEKDAAGATRLFPLSDFHPRKEENTERRYLGGSYGAVPALFADSLADELAERSIDGAA